MAFISRLCDGNQILDAGGGIFEFFGDVHDQPQVVLDERAPCFFIGFDALNERRLVLAGEGGGQRLRPVYVLQGRSRRVRTAFGYRRAADAGGWCVPYSLVPFFVYVCSFGCSRIC